MAVRRQRALEAEERKRGEEAAAAEAAARPKPAPKVEAAAPVVRQLYMHEGLDLLANIGTPIYAAADGVVTSFGPNGGYGNFIRLTHADRLATVYGHLSRFAPALAAGQPVSRGELIGFVGSTGRSTGAHLHFEIQNNGRPINPATAPSMRCPQLAGADLAAFKKQVAASAAERERESRL
jgi:murein DD-endopeptidase MepM/ murein hydrolase activator NlpD